MNTGTYSIMIIIFKQIYLKNKPVLEATNRETISSRIGVTVVPRLCVIQVPIQRRGTRPPVRVNGTIVERTISASIAKQGSWPT